MPILVPLRLSVCSVCQKATKCSSSAHSLVLGEGIQAKLFLELTWIIPLTAETSQAIPFPKFLKFSSGCLHPFLSFLPPDAHTAKGNYF